MAATPDIRQASAFRADVVRSAVPAAQPRAHLSFRVMEGGPAGPLGRPDWYRLALHPAERPPAQELPAQLPAQQLPARRVPARRVPAQRVPPDGQEVLALQAVGLQEGLVSAAARHRRMNGRSTTRQWRTWVMRR